MTSTSFKALTDPHLWFAYRIGVLLALGRRKVASAEVYVGGVADTELSSWLSGRLKRAGLEPMKPFAVAERQLSMIPKSMPSGRPEGGRRFSDKVMLKNDKSNPQDIRRCAP